MIIPCIDLMDGKVVQLVQDREKAIGALQHELELYRKVCEQIDSGKITEDLRRLVDSDWFIISNDK